LPFFYQGRQDLNPRSQDLESRALANYATALNKLLRLLMQCMLPTGRAILFIFNLLRMLFLVLLCSVIAILAILTFKYNYLSALLHFMLLLLNNLCYNPGTYCSPTLANSEIKPLLECNWGN
jgi:hypothetical protein